MQLSNALLNIQRLEKHREKYYEIKDPSIVKVSDSQYIMYASIGNSLNQEWIVGRFESSHPSALWRELEPVVFENLSGPQLCAPAVTFTSGSGFEMYIQTACFEENGQIVLATSQDGQHFTGYPQPVVTREHVNQTDNPVVGVYDVGVSEVMQENEELICMLYSGYRAVGSGDIYVSYKKKNSQQLSWSRGERLISQEDVPFHNNPNYEHFEWGLEGAKLIQLAPDCFVIIGVCFMPKPKEFLGNRQRVFFAASQSLHGPFIPLGFPFMPTDSEFKQGENGHPDTLIEGQTLWTIYQERYGDGKPWHLRVASFDLPKLETFIKQQLLSAQPEYLRHTPKEPETYHFSYANV